MILQADQQNLMSWRTCILLTTNPSLPLPSHFIILIFPCLSYSSLICPVTSTAIIELSWDSANSCSHQSDNNGKHLPFAALLTVHFYWCLIMASSYIKKRGRREVLEFPPTAINVIVASILCLYAFRIMVDVCTEASQSTRWHGLQKLYFLVSFVSHCCCCLVLRMFKALCSLENVDGLECI
jgi:hypothetical protein